MTENKQQPQPKLPKWIQDLVLGALEYWESQGHEVSIPIIKVRHSSLKRFHSSGVCYTATNNITVTLGKDRTDAKLVILHELAHALAPNKEHHSDKFWEIAWSLYRWAKLPMRYTLAREANYRKGAKKVYKDIKNQEQ